MSLEQFANSPTPSTPSTPWSTITSAINSTDTSITVASATPFPTSPQFRLVLGDEIVIVTSVAGATFTITRGAESTTAASHASGASVFLVLTAASLLRCPGALTSTGDIGYLNSSGAPTRLAAGSDGQYLRYASSLPTASALLLADLTGLGTGVATFLGTPSSANLASAITDETGSGALVFATSPALTTPNLGTPSAGVLSACIGLPLTTGVTGILPAANGGTGVANSSTITLGGNLTTSGAYATTFTMTAATGVTFPTTGTLATLAGTEAFTNKTGNISQWTNDSGYLTAVTAHNVLSATHGDTLAASVTRGDVIIGNSTPKWARLAIGSASRYLASDGTDVSWGQVSLTAGVTGTLPVANGGTGVTASTGSVALVLSTSPTLVTPVLGVATCTSLNGNTFTTGTYTLTGAASKVLTFNNSLTLAGTDSTTMTFPSTSATIARTDAAQTFTGSQTFGAVLLAANGIQSAPAYSFTSKTNSGIYCDGGSNLILVMNGGIGAYIQSGQLLTPKLDIGANGDLFLTRTGAASLKFGLDVNGAAVSQTLSACNGITGTDRTGGNLTLASGVGTGAGAVSSLIFQTPTVLASGTTAQSLATRLTIDSSGLTVADATNIVLNATTGTKIGTATTQKLGFYGATPITCAVLATGASHTVDDVITSLQNLGLVKQS